MYETIEAIYDEGRIIPLHDELKVKKAKVFLTIIEDIDNGSQSRGMPLENLKQCKGIFKKFPEGLAYQKALRDKYHTFS